MRAIILVVILFFPAVAPAENLDITDQTIVEDLIRLDGIMSDVSSAVMGCMDKGKAHKECMCESKSLFERFTESANELLKTHSALEGQDLINFKNPDGVLVNLSLEGVKKQAAMELSCD